MTKPVGKLRKIDLNEVWGNEPDGFGSWLQQEEILEMLGESIGVPLKPAGGNNPLETLPGGVLAKDAKHGHYVIVCGHLNGINSDTLGKLIMYSAGLEAKAFVCVGQEITSEIRRSLDWLNTVSRENVSFYATELELWRIDDSVPAPNFNVVCQPNMWARQLKMGQDENEGNGAQEPKDSPESQSKKEDSGQGSTEKVAAGDKSGKDGVSVRQNFVYTKTFS
ncbi:MAG: hypothetical protein IH978_01710 [Nitrospinae bacterium]|nr:hypothetical protein [Nitrospinota bacterium]